MVGHAQECHVECCYIPQVLGIGHMCVTQSDTFRYARLRWVDDSVLAMEMEAGTTARRGHHSLDTTRTKQLLGLQQV